MSLFQLLVMGLFVSQTSLGADSPSRVVELDIYNEGASWRIVKRARSLTYLYGVTSNRGLFSVFSLNKDGDFNLNWGDLGRFTHTGWLKDMEVTWTRTYLLSHQPKKLALLALNAQGKLDTSFGFRGKLFIKNVFEARAMEIDSAGRILVLAKTGKNEDGPMNLYRFLSSGRKDPSFGDGGMVQIAPLEQELEVQMKLDSRERVVLVGKSKAVRLLPDGRLDKEFGQDGQTPLAYHGHTPFAGEAFVLLPDDSLVLAGSHGEWLIVTEVDEQGRPSTGYKRFPHFQLVSDIKLGMDGSIFILGRVTSERRFGGVITKLTSDLEYDQGFGEGGIWRGTPFNRIEFVTFVPSHGGGGFTIAGSSSYAVAGPQRQYFLQQGF